MVFLPEPPVVVVVEPVVVCVRDEVRWLWAPLLGLGAPVPLEVLEVVVVEDEVEPEVVADELDEEEPEPLELELELELDPGAVLALLVAVVVLEDEAVGAHDSLSDTTTPWIGRFMAEIGVPGATFTLNV